MKRAILSLMEPPRIHELAFEVDGSVLRADGLVEAYQRGAADGGEDVGQDVHGRR
jgi:hypothetical protein